MRSRPANTTSQNSNACSPALSQSQHDGTASATNTSASRNWRQRMSNTALEAQEPQKLAVVQDAPTMITPMTMIDRALISGAAPETLEKLLALQERWEANQGRKA